ncbi:hypothetical protein TgHK011_006355 [Trichoderma gracile]|nr:hypothetical protein TgHK011_006355 [Trichoderma gracile]
MHQPPASSNCSFLPVVPGRSSTNPSVISVSARHDRRRQLDGILALWLREPHMEAPAAFRQENPWLGDGLRSALLAG